MLLVLPPSETKRDGGAEGSALDLASLLFPELTRRREQALRALARLSRSVQASAEALALGPTQRFEIDRNRAVRGAPTMPAIERYTGVLYDALDASSLTPAARAWLERHVVIHSALFGPVGAGDLIPAYRLSHNSRLPGLALRAHWRTPLAAALGAGVGLVLDLRSESYVALGPITPGPERWYLRVVSIGPTGQKRALTHFNKQGKGAFVQAIAIAGIDHPDAASLLAWAATAGIALTRGAPGELELTV